MKLLFLFRQRKPTENYLDLISQGSCITGEKYDIFIRAVARYRRNSKKGFR